MSPDRTDHIDRADDRGTDAHPPRADGPLEPVSTHVSRTVPAAKAAQFEELLHEVITAARAYPGHLGVDVLRPEGGGTYQMIFRYRTHADNAVWMDSGTRHELVARIDDLLDDGAVAAVRSVDGWEGWFVTPGYAPPLPPRRWKMALITLSALYPIVLTVLTASRPLTGGWPTPLALLLTTGVSIPLMTWVVMPFLTRRIGAWLRR